MFTRANAVFAFLIKEYVCSLEIDNVDIVKANSTEEINGSLLNSIFNNSELTIKSSPEIQKRILVITHGGWILNCLNVILYQKIGKILKEYSSRNTSLYVIRIYCKECNGVCSIEKHDHIIENQMNQCGHSIEISIETINDISHLS